MSPIAAGVTAAVLGIAMKSGFVDKLPAIPVIGRLGTVAIGAHYWARHGGGKLARDVALCAAVIAGYQLGTEGSIHGDDE